MIVSVIVSSMLVVVFCTVGGCDLVASEKAVVYIESRAKKRAYRYGTGFYVEFKADERAAEDNSLIVTCYHVVEGAERLTTIDRVGNICDSQKHQVHVVAVRPSHDLAVLRVGPLKNEPMFLSLHSQPNEIAPNNTLKVIGYPNTSFKEFAAKPTNKGLVSSLSFRDANENRIFLDEIRVIAIDTTAGVGNSGGPLILGEKVVGVVAGTVRTSREVLRSVGWAIPSTDVAELIKDLSGEEGEGLPEKWDPLPLMLDSKFFVSRYRYDFNTAELVPLRDLLLEIKERAKAWGKQEWIAFERRLAERSAFMARGAITGVQSLGETSILLTVKPFDSGFVNDNTTFELQTAVKKALVLDAFRAVLSKEELRTAAQDLVAILEPTAERDKYCKVDLIGTVQRVSPLGGGEFPGSRGGKMFFNTKKMRFASRAEKESIRTPDAR